MKILLIVMSFLLFSYNNVTTNVQAEEKKNEISSPVLQTLANVLLNEQKFYCTNFNQFIFLNELDSLFFEEGEPYSFTFLKFAIVDFDANEIPEIVLEMRCGGAGFFEIFRYKEGEIYSYELGSREMQNLQKNGTFVSSGGAADNSLGRLKFLGKYYDIDEQAYSKSNIDGSINYCLYDKPIDSELFTKLAYAKDTVEWYAFTEKNITEKLIQNSDSQWLNPTIQTDIEKQNYFDSLAYLIELEERNRPDIYYDAWDKELNKIYQLLLKKLSETEMEQLRTEQREWIKRRDELARYQYEMWSNSDSKYFRDDALSIHFWNMADTTRRRTYYLIDLYFNNK